MQRVILGLFVTMLAACAPAMPAELPATATPSATATGTPRPTPTATATPLPTLPPFPTPYRLPRSVVEPDGLDLSGLLPTFREISLDHLNLTEQTSPGGEWIVRRYWVEAVGDVNAYTYARLDLQLVDGSQSYTVYEQVAFAGLGGFYPTIIAWEMNERTAYLSEGIVTDGCVLFESYYGLTRIDLSSGLQTRLVDNYLGDAAVSADGKWLANIPAQRLSDERYSIQLTDLNTGELNEIQIPLEGANAAGAFVWSPDSNQVAFTLLKDGCEPSQHAILILDVTILEIRVALDFQDVYLFTEDWGGDGLILKETERGRIYTETVDYWILDLSTGQLSPYEFKP